MKDNKCNLVVITSFLLGTWDQISSNHLFYNSYSGKEKYKLGFKYIVNKLCNILFLETFQ